MDKIYDKHALFLVPALAFDQTKLVTTTNDVLFHPKCLHAERPWSLEVEKTHDHERGGFLFFWNHLSRGKSEYPGGRYSFILSYPRPLQNTRL